MLRLRFVGGARLAAGRWLLTAILFQRLFPKLVKTIAAHEQNGGEEHEQTGPHVGKEIVAPRCSVRFVELRVAHNEAQLCQLLANGGGGEDGHGQQCVAGQVDDRTVCKLERVVVVQASFDAIMVSVGPREQHNADKRENDNEWQRAKVDCQHRAVDLRAAIVAALAAALDRAAARTAFLRAAAGGKRQSTFVPPQYGIVAPRNEPKCGRAHDQVYRAQSAVC